MSLLMWTLDNEVEAVEVSPTGEAAPSAGMPSPVKLALNSNFLWPPIWNSDSFAGTGRSFHAAPRQMNALKIISITHFPSPWVSNWDSQCKTKNTSQHHNKAEGTFQPLWTLPDIYLDMLSWTSREILGRGVIELFDQTFNPKSKWLFSQRSVNEHIRSGPRYMWGQNNQFKITTLFTVTGEWGSFRTAPKQRVALKRVITHFLRPSDWVSIQNKE